MSEENGLIVIDKIKPAEVFTEDNIGQLIEMVKEKALEEDLPEGKTAKERKELTSLARKVSSSKVALDNLGKGLVTDLKAQANVVDRARKIMRDSLDELRDEIKKPVTEYETEQQRKKEEEEAKRRAALEEKQREIEQREAELRKKEEEAAELKARQELEAKLAKEAAEKAERDKAEAIRLERERADAAIRAEKEKALAAERERERVMAQKEAEEKRRLADRHHRARINCEARDDLCANGYTIEEATQILTFIAQGQIRHVSINY